MSPIDVVCLVIAGCVVLLGGYVAVDDLLIRLDWHRHPIRFNCDLHPAGMVCKECSLSTIRAGIESRL